MPYIDTLFQVSYTENHFVLFKSTCWRASVRRSLFHFKGFCRFLPSPPWRGVVVSALGLSRSDSPLCFGGLGKELLALSARWDKMTRMRWQKWIERVVLYVLTTLVVCLALYFQGDDWLKDTKLWSRGVISATSVLLIYSAFVAVYDCLWSCGLMFPRRNFNGYWGYLLIPDEVARESSSKGPIGKAHIGVFNLRQDSFYISQKGSVYRIQRASGKATQTIEPFRKWRSIAAEYNDVDDELVVVWESKPRGKVDLDGDPSSHRGVASLSRDMVTPNEIIGHYEDLRPRAACGEVKIYRFNRLWKLLSVIWKWQFPQKQILNELLKKDEVLQKLHNFYRGDIPTR